MNVVVPLAVTGVTGAEITLTVQFVSAEIATSGVPVRFRSVVPSLRMVYVRLKGEVPVLVTESLPPSAIETPARCTSISACAARGLANSNKAISRRGIGSRLWRQRGARQQARKCRRGGHSARPFVVEHDLRPSAQANHGDRAKQAQQDDPCRSVAGTAATAAATPAATPATPAATGGLYGERVGVSVCRESGVGNRYAE